jgi:hypothetical protein
MTKQPVISNMVIKYDVNSHHIAIVGTLPKGYIRNVPLPRAPRGQSAKLRIQVIRYLGNGTRYPVTTIPDYYATPYVVPTYVSPRSVVESAAYAFSPAWHAIAINT